MTSHPAGGPSALPAVAAGALAAFMVMAAILLYPQATLPPEVHEARTGTGREVVLPIEGAPQRNYSWEYQVLLPDDPAVYRLEPDLPYQVALRGSAGRSNHLRLDVRVLINGQVALARTTDVPLALTSTAPSTAQGERVLGAGRLVADDDQVDQRSVRRGMNTVRVEVAVTLAVADRAGGAVRLALGPAVTKLAETDADGDGVKDAHQFVRAIPTPYLAAAAALPAGVLGFLAWRGAEAWWQGHRAPRDRR